MAYFPGFRPFAALRAPQREHDTLRLFGTFYNRIVLVRKGREWQAIGARKKKRSHGGTETGRNKANSLCLCASVAVGLDSAKRER
jgi:hypothetical protein